MLSAAELEAAALALDTHMCELQMRIMQDIVRRIRINGEITAAADWQIHRVQQLGMSKREIKKYIKETLDLTNAEINHLYKDVLRKGYARDESLYKFKGKPFIPFDKNDGLLLFISAVSEQTANNLENITQSMGFAIRQPDGSMQFSPIADYYQKTLDRAMLDISSGAFDYNAVLKRTVSEMVQGGICTVDYASGCKRNIVSAARTAVMTGMSQLTAKINEENAKALDSDKFEVTWHSGARPEHQVWQGKWYTHEQLVSVCGLGSVTGLCGANCHHDYYVVIDGISEPTYTEEELERMNREENTPIYYDPTAKSYTKYEALQRQRRLENTMRKQRQKIKLLQEGYADESDILAARARYRGTSQEYTAFSEAMGLPQQRERVTADGLGDVRKFAKSIDISGGSGIIELENNAMFRKKKDGKIEPMPKRQFQRIVKRFKAQGGLIQFGDETDAYLQSKNAEAITYNATTILIHQNPGRACVFEELIHTAQYRNGRNDGSYPSRLRCEIEAQEKLLRYAKAYKLTEPEIYQTQKALEAYQKELDDYLKNGGA